MPDFESPPPLNLSYESPIPNHICWSTNVLKPSPPDPPDETPPDLPPDPPDETPYMDIRQCALLQLELGIHSRLPPPVLQPFPSLPIATAGPSSSVFPPVAATVLDPQFDPG